MTTASQEPDPDASHGIGDDQLPTDLRPDDNALAEGLEVGETAADLSPGELLHDGKTDDSGADEAAVDAADDADPGGDS